ncbi:MAG: DUF2752 domain-containing protein [Clostridia bacterium]|nr:DUF2752 domain-containing protein [Clostridia bacterium]
MTDKQKKKILKVVRDNLLILGIVLIFEVALYFIFGVNCPTRLITKIECPFCGMTRAHLAALRLDFKAAFSYHPFFFIGIPFLILIFNEDVVKGKWKIPYWITVSTMTALLVLKFILQFI